MALIIEDGTGIAGANSYATAEEARAYAILRGVTLPAVPGVGADPVETFLVLAAEYLNSLSWVALLATATQGLQWPRVFDFPYLAYPFYPYDIAAYWEQYLPFDPAYYVLPDKIKAAQNQLAIEQFQGVDLMPTTIGGTQFITREKVDVIETSYSERLGTLASPTMPRVEALLKGLLVVGGTSSLRTVRG